MWFSYPREESWIPLPIHRVKEIQQMNREGIIPADLGEIVELETKPVKILDYENVVGQDSLTRLDERRNNNNKKKHKNRNKGNKPAGAAEGAPQRAEATAQPAAQVPKPAENKTAEGGNNNRNKRNRPHRNNNRDNQQNKPQ